MRLTRLIMLGVTLSAPVLACDCIRVKSFCEQLPDSKDKDLAIFIGTVTDEYPPQPYTTDAARVQAILTRWKDVLTEKEYQEAWRNKLFSPAGPWLSRLRVSEVLQGPPTAEIIMAGGWSDCD